MLHSSRTYVAEIFEQPAGSRSCKTKGSDEARLTTRNRDGIRLLERVVQISDLGQQVSLFVLEGGGLVREGRWGGGLEVV